MKTTIDIDDALLTRARRHGRKAGKTLRAVVEEGIRRVLEERSASTGYVIPDCSVGKAGTRNPLEALTWPELRNEIYGER